MAPPRPVLFQPVAVRPMSPSCVLSAEGLKKAKRKASVTHAIDDTALRHVHLSTSPILLPLLDASKANNASASALSLSSSAAFCSFLPLPPAALSVPAAIASLSASASLWHAPPPFLASMLLRFFDGRTLAACLHINAAFRRDLVANHLSTPFESADDSALPLTPSEPSSAVGTLCVDQETHDAVAVEAVIPSIALMVQADAASFSSLSSSATTLLRSLYSTNIAHQLHTLKLSTARLTKQTCTLMSSLLFLRHLELRLFEHLADEWKTDFLSSAAGPWYGADLFFLPSSSTLSTHSAYSVNDLPAITASAASLRSALRRLVNLQTVSVVGFVDVEDSDDLPVTSAHSSAILDAMANLRVKRLQLKDGHFARSHGYGSVLTERRVRAMRELESVHVVDAARWDAAQLQALFSCSQLLDVRLSGDICLSPPQLQAMSAAFTAIRSLRVDPVVVEDVRLSACRQVDEAEALLTRCCLHPTLDTTLPGVESSVCVTAFLSPLLFFSHLTSLHLTFTTASLTGPYPASPVSSSPHSATALLSPSSSSSTSAYLCAPQQPVSFCADLTVWESLWLPSSPLVRHLRHLTLPVLCGARMSAVLACAQLVGLRLVGPLPVDGEWMSSLHAGRAAACNTLRDLSLPCSVSQLPIVNAWLDELQSGVSGVSARVVWPLLCRVQIVEAGVDGVEAGGVVLLDKLCC